MSNVSQIKRKAVKITLNDGIERTIKFTLNALAELEDKFGSVQAAFDLLEKQNSMKALRAILWSGFLHESPELTEQQVGNLIDIDYMQNIMETLGDAFDNDLDKAEEEEVGASPNE